MAALVSMHTYFLLFVVCFFNAGACTPSTISLSLSLSCLLMAQYSPESISRYKSIVSSIAHSPSLSLFHTHTLSPSTTSLSPSFLAAVPLFLAPSLHSILPSYISQPTTTAIHPPPSALFVF
ncbi:MAG: hypothetical protein JOS17DRAFT_366653 [Linnemannia elongata]|nr:MAG: hypothetical protein JOS17DRAFT_366653 [Linnemannia elongata]